MTKEWHVVYRHGIPQAAFAIGPDVTAYITGRKWTEVEICTCEVTFTELAQLDAFGKGERDETGDRGEAGGTWKRQPQR